MTGKQNFIFFLGLTLIILNFWLQGEFKTLALGIFKGPANAKGTSIPTGGNGGLFPGGAIDPLNHGIL